MKTTQGNSHSEAKGWIALSEAIFAEVEADLAAGKSLSDVDWFRCAEYEDLAQELTGRRELQKGPWRTAWLKTVYESQPEMSRAENIRAAFVLTVSHESSPLGLGCPPAAGPRCPRCGQPVNRAKHEAIKRAGAHGLTLHQALDTLGLDAFRHAHMTEQQLYRLLGREINVNRLLSGSLKERCLENFELLRRGRPSSEMRKVRSRKMRKKDRSKS
jgi:hypothetical protein